MTANWEEVLKPWIGRFVEVQIVDEAGEDPVAPPRVEVMHDAKADPQGGRLNLYLNPKQFLSVPLAEDARLEGRTFESRDRAAKLVYRMHLI